MRRIIKACCVLLIIAVPGIMIVPSFARSASAQGCRLVICLEADGAGDAPFNIRIEDGGKTDKKALVDMGPCIQESFDPPNTLKVTESPMPGWVLDDVVCTDLKGIKITKTKDGFAAECASSGEGGCTLENEEGTAR